MLDQVDISQPEVRMQQPLSSLVEEPLAQEVQGSVDSALFAVGRMLVPLAHPVSAARATHHLPARGLRLGLGTLMPEATVVL